MYLRGVFVIVVLWLYVHAQAQINTLQAVKATTAPKIDGTLDDAAWQNAPIATGFIQNYPSYGVPASQKTEVKVVYDDAAVYVGAFLHDDPSLIRTQLTARDGEQRQDVDYFSIFFDTYNDQQNGFQFLVTASGVQTDARLGGNTSNNGFGSYGDKTWDAVWQSKTTITNTGWIVEMRIPYISLRFAKKEVQTWGLQLLRFSRRNNESSFWNVVNPNINGFVNQFGKYEGLKNILPPLRLSFSPYLSGGVRSTPGEVNSKTVYKNEWLRSGGMDIKYGINESFTLDATLVPDFGQVISDNIVNNLTPYEIRFKDNRPFFTEGTELFNKASLFYSRRIGSTPRDYNFVNNLVANRPNLELQRNPGVTQLYNAIKLSGRTQKKLGIGVFNAVTAPMQATLLNKTSGLDTTIQTEPLTNYNIIVLDQAFKGQSFVTFTNTNVIRNGADRDANVSALNFAAYDKTNTYAVTGAFKYSKIFGLTPYNTLLTPYRFNSTISTQTINGRLYANPYDGYKSNLRLGKVSGKIQYYADVMIESENFDPNDLGFLRAANEVNYETGVSYQQFTPTKNFISYNYNLRLIYNWIYKPYAVAGTEINARATWIFKNFWDVSINAGTQPYWQNDYFELQTKGLFVKKPPYLYLFTNGSTDSRKRLFFSYEVGFADAGVFANNHFIATSAGVRYRFSNRFNLSLNNNRQHDRLQIGYAFTREQDGRPILGFRDFKDVSTILSGNYSFTPLMNITLRARHYWNKVRYLSFHNVKSDGYYQERPFINDQDENFNIFNLDAFFTWDFKPGSRIIVGWKNWLGNDYLFHLNGNGYTHYLKNLTNTFTLPHGNELTLRIIYFLDYNALRKKL